MIPIGMMDKPTKLFGNLFDKKEGNTNKTNHHKTDKRLNTVCNSQKDNRKERKDN